jgi:hypothetical protein
MKRFFIGIGLVAAVLGIAAYLVTQRLSVEELRPAIERDLAEALRLDVQVVGPLKIELFPEIAVEIEDVRVANLPGRPSPYMLQVGRLALEPRLLPLFRRMLVIDSLELHDVELRIEPDEQGDWSLRPDLDELEEAPTTTDKDPLALVIEQVEVLDLEVYFDRHAEEDVTTLRVRELFAKSDGPESPLSIEARGSFEGSVFEIEADTGTLTELLEPIGPVPLAVRLSLPDMEIEAEGMLGHPRTLAGLELRFDAELRDLAGLFRNLDLVLPPMGAVELSGILVERDSFFGVEQFLARSAPQDPLRIEIEGSVRDVVSLEGVDLSLRVVAPDADIFKELTLVSLPGVPLRAMLEIDDEDGSLGVEGQADVIQVGRFKLSMEGVFGDLRRLRELDLRVGLETERLDAIVSSLAREISWKIPELGAVEATGRLSLEGGSLGLEEIEARVGDPATFQLRATGSIGNLMEIQEVSIEARLEAESSRNVAALFDREIPEIGPLTASMSIQDRDGSLGIENLAVALGSTDRLQILLEGGFDDLLDLEEIVVDASLTARDLALLGDFVDLDLPAVGPVAFRGKLRGSVDSLVSTGRLGLGQTVVDGELQAALSPGGRPRVDLRLDSPRLHLPDLIRPARDQRRMAGAREENGFDMRRWWRGQQSLSLDFLRDFDGTLRLEADRVTGYELLDLAELGLSARLEDGSLVVDEFGAGYEEGRVVGSLEIDARPASPRAKLELDAYSIDLTRLIAQFDESTEYAGKVDLLIDLETQGTKVDEVRQNLQGRFAAMLRDGALVNEYSRAFSFNFLRVSVPSLAPPQWRRHPCTAYFSWRRSRMASQRWKSSIFRAGGSRSAVGDVSIWRTMSSISA